MRYLHTPRTIDDSVILRAFHEVHETIIKNILLELGNRNAETLMETLIFAHNDIWAQIERSMSVDGSHCFLMNANLVENDILTNGREINSMLNRLGPRMP